MLPLVGGAAVQDKSKVYLHANGNPAMIPGGGGSDDKCNASLDEGGLVCTYLVGGRSAQLPGLAGPRADGGHPALGRRVGRSRACARGRSHGQSCRRGGGVEGVEKPRELSVT